MPTALLLLSLAMAVAAQGMIVARAYLGAPPFLYLGAIIALAAALRNSRPATAPQVVVPRPPTEARSIWIGRVFTVGGAATAIGCSIWLHRDWARALPFALGLGPLALLYLATGQDILLGYADRWPLRWRRLRAGLRKPEVLGVFAIVALAAVFRFATIGDFPPVDGFSSIEETQRASGGLSVVEKGHRPWEFPLPQYLAAAAFWAFGPSIHALRVPVMLLGCLTMIPFYFLAREFTGVPAAMFAAVLLAVSRWHVQVSWYNEDVYTPLAVFVLILCLLARTRREARPFYYVLLGACCGYTLYDYAGFRGTSLVVIAFLAGDAIRRRREVQDLRQMALFAGVLALFVFPLAGVLGNVGSDFYFEAIGRSMANRGYYTSDPWSFIAQRLERIGAAADMFTYTDHAAFFPSLNTRSEPLLDPFTGAAFVLGLGVTLLHWRARFHAFFSLAFLFLAAGATVLVQNLDFRRLAALVPFVFIFVALLADKIDRFAALAGRPRAWRAALAATALAAGAYNYNFLFRVLAPDHEVRAQHRDDYTVPAFYLQRHYHGEYVVLLTERVHNFFLSNDYDWIKPAGLTGHAVHGVEGLFSFDPPPPEGKDVLILLQRRFDIAVVIEQLRAFYPGAECGSFPDPDASRLDLGACRVPAAVVRAARNPWDPGAPSSAPSPS